jgi:hypothetical protein
MDVPEGPKTKDYMFMASAHGLDSINPVDVKSFGVMQLACDANQQRFAIFGTVSLTEPVYKAFVHMLDDKEDKQLALNLIKKTMYRFPTGKVKLYSHNMALIPNPVLDPYGGKRLNCETENIKVKICQNRTQ